MKNGNDDSILLKSKNARDLIFDIGNFIKLEDLNYEILELDAIYSEGNNYFRNLTLKQIK